MGFQVLPSHHDDRYLPIQQHVYSVPLRIMACGRSAYSRGMWAIRHKIRSVRSRISGSDLLAEREPVDREISEWPDLLHLYSRLKPGITVFQWMHDFDTHKHGIDPRRFVSFGVIKVLSYKYTPILV